MSFVLSVSTQIVGRNPRWDATRVGTGFVLTRNPRWDANTANTKLMATQALIRATDRATVMRCLSAYVSWYAATAAEREAAVDAIRGTMRAFPRDAGVVGGCLCALAHASGFGTVSLPVEAILDAVKPFEASPLMVQAAARVLMHHARSPRVLDGLPSLAEAAARWIGKHPTSRNVAYFCAHILIRCAGQEPDDVQTFHGRMGEEAVAVAVVAGCVATQVIEVTVQGAAWNAYILATLYPRLRARG